MELFIPLFVLAFFIYFFAIVFTKWGKGTMFGGKIADTMDEEIKRRKGIATTTIRVHSIEKKDEVEKSIGIEVTQNAILGWSMNPINLSKSETLTLISMLQEAVKK